MIEETINMLLITNLAKQRLLTICKEDEFLRVNVVSGGCHGFSYKFEIGKEIFEDDFIYEQEGKKLVVMKKNFLNLISNPEIDYVETLSASYFTMKSSSFTTSCGCGTSFSLNNSI